jgi:hypothetical protein
MSDSYFVCVGIYLAISVLYNLVLLRVVCPEGARVLREAARQMLSLRWRVLAIAVGSWVPGWFLWYLPMWITIPFLVLCMSMGILGARLAVPSKKPVFDPLFHDGWHQRWTMARQAHESYEYSAKLASDPDAYAVWNEARFRNEALADEICSDKL